MLTKVTLSYDLHTMLNSILCSRTSKDLSVGGVGGRYNPFRPPTFHVSRVVFVQISYTLTSFHELCTKVMQVCTLHCKYMENRAKYGRIRLSGEERGLCPSCPARGAGGPATCPGRLARYSAPQGPSCSH